MDKLKKVTGKFVMSQDFLTSINEMIEDGEFDTSEEIITYVKECMIEDILAADSIYLEKFINVVLK